MSLDAMEWVRGTVWLYLHHPIPKTTLLRAKTDLLSLWFLLWGKWESVWMSTWIPHCVGHSQRGSFLSPVQGTELWAAWLGRCRGRLGGHQIGLLEGIKGTQILLCHRLHQEACPWAAGGTLPADPPNWPMGTPSVLCASSPAPRLLWWLPVHAPTGGSKSELWQMASEHVQKIDLNLRTRENLQTWVSGLLL